MRIKNVYEKDESHLKNEQKGLTQQRDRRNSLKNEKEIWKTRNIGKGKQRQ